MRASSESGDRNLQWVELVALREILYKAAKLNAKKSEFIELKNFGC